MNKCYEKYRIVYDYGKSNFSFQNPKFSNTSRAQEFTSFTSILGHTNVYILSGQQSRILPEPSGANHWGSGTLRE